MTIDQFIFELAEIENTCTLTNPYKNSVQKNNLTIYLNYMIKNPPKYLFVGEAPGYLGCALTGIPFTDEFRLTLEWEKGPLLSLGYEIKSKEKPHEENSATVIWNTFSEKSFFPLLWNIVPFHPHEANNRNSNRTPTSKEIETYGCEVRVVFLERDILPAKVNVFYENPSTGNNFTWLEAIRHNQQSRRNKRDMDAR